MKPLVTLRAVRVKPPVKLITAAAVASPDAVKQIAAEADGVVCAEMPDGFYAVGQFFQEFSQVSHVVAILQQSSSKPGPQP